jgi:sporulation protein YlmC with PRC-barrel domain
MSETFRSALGRKVVSRASAEALGTVSHFVVGDDHKRVAAIVLGKGRRARIIDWGQLSGFGPDAVMVIDDGALRPPVDDHDRAASRGQSDLLGKRALSELGDELGHVDDVVFDPVSGELVLLVIGEQEHPVSSLFSNGPYAAVISQPVISRPQEGP